MDEAERGCPGRSSLPTVARSDEADGSALSDFEHALDEPRLTWAVDAGVGVEMRAYSTFDLWYALNVGQLQPDVRVWRLGREAWTRACDVPELRCALNVSPSLAGAGRAERTTLDYTLSPPSFGAAEPAETAAESSPTASAETPAETSAELAAETPAETVADAPRTDEASALTPNSVPPLATSALDHPDLPAALRRDPEAAAQAASMPAPRMVIPIESRRYTPRIRRTVVAAFAAVAAFAVGFSVAASAANDVALRAAGENVDVTSAALSQSLSNGALEVPGAKAHAPAPEATQLEPAAPVAEAPAEKSPSEKSPEATSTAASPAKDADAALAPSSSATPKAKATSAKAQPKISNGRKKSWSPTSRGQHRTRQKSK
ncbi:MAG: hypothetical protein HOW73_25800 [Polyangiaceae bacterium]|nr:hypothetical protein [Polyangiaceae bacterium]